MSKFALRTFSGLVLIASCPLPGAGQQTTSPTALPVGREFPVVMAQNVVAGKAPVGTKVQAKLVAATLVDGTVIPRNALLSGAVIESVAKTSGAPSELAIRMDSAKWKNGSATIKIYLIGWFYPSVTQSGQDLQYGPQQPANRTWNGEGQYPDPNSRIYKPFPSDSSDKNSSVPDTASSAMATHRVAMKDVESFRGNDGVITLVSKRSNIKLDKLTTYVLVPGDLLPTAAK
jgi:hypothetical protein